MLLKQIEAVAQVNSEIVARICERKTQRLLKYDLHFDEAQKRFVAKEIRKEFNGICDYVFPFDLAVNDSCRLKIRWFLTRFYVC